MFMKREYETVGEKRPKVCYCPFCGSINITNDTHDSDPDRYLCIDEDEYFTARGIKMSNEGRDRVKEMLERFRIKIDGVPTDRLILADDKLIDKILKYGKEKFDDGFHLGYQRGSRQ